MKETEGAITHSKVVISEMKLNPLDKEAAKVTGEWVSGADYLITKVAEQNSLANEWNYPRRNVCKTRWKDALVFVFEFGNGLKTRGRRKSGRKGALWGFNNSAKQGASNRHQLDQAWFSSHDLGCQTDITGPKITKEAILGYVHGRKHVGSRRDRVRKRRGGSSGRAKACDKAICDVLHKRHAGR